MVVAHHDRGRSTQLDRLVLLGSIGVKHDCVEGAVLTAHGNFTVRNGRVKVDGIARAQNFHVVADLYLESAVNDDIALLTLVRYQGDGGVFRSFAVGRTHEQRLGNSAFEGVRHVVVGKTVRLLDLLTCAAACQRIGLQLGRRALDDLGHVHAQRLCAAVDEREVHISLACFAIKIFLLGDARSVCHIGNAQPLDLAQLADTRRHFDYFLFKSCQITHVIDFSFVWLGSGKKHARLKPA